MLEILILIGSVHTDEERIVSNLVYQDVVDESAVFVQQARILSLPVLQLRHRVGGDVIGQLRRFRPADFNLAHVADIEEPHGISNGVVLVNQAGIGNRHIPTAKINHPGAGGPVDVV